MSDKQIQKAGDNSQQIQATTVIIQNGITEERARAVYSEMSMTTIKECTDEATAKVLERFTKFADVFIPRMEKIENDFKSLTDPSFQFLLQSAQKTAACTDREVDYELLSELLVHRIEKKNERKTKASITKAVEIVDQIDDDALCALTVCHIINTLTVTAETIEDGIKKLNDLFESVIYMELPKDYEWINHLDILNTIRLEQFREFKKLEEFYFESLDGYFCVGIQKDSLQYQQALELLKEVYLPSSVLMNHELLEGYVRLPVSQKARIKDLSRTIPITNAPTNLTITLRKKLTKEQVAALEKIWELYSNDAVQKEILKKAFIEKINSFESLKKVCLWWNNLKTYFYITPIGSVLAHANTQRLNKEIPNLDGDKN